MPKFIVQEHDAPDHLHWDFRLERDGITKSWIVTKGVPLEEKIKRLGIMTPDQKLAPKIEETPPDSEWGEGEVKTWDSGTYEIQDELEQGKQKKKVLKIVMAGKKVKGLYTLVEFIPPRRYIILKG